MVVAVTFRGTLASMCFSAWARCLVLWDDPSILVFAVADHGLLTDPSVLSAVAAGTSPSPSISPV